MVARRPKGLPSSTRTTYYFDVLLSARELRAKCDSNSKAVYSGVASLRSLRIVCLLAELNGLKLTGGDVRNAYLEACTTEKVCVRAGPEFGPLEGHLLVIEKALYGLHTSGARFHAKFADTLRAMGFTPTYAPECMDTRCW